MVQSLYRPISHHGRRCSIRSMTMKENDKPVMNKYSKTITQPPSQGASQAMLYATGLTTESIQSAQVGICSVWFEGNPCNMHLLDLSQSVKEGVSDAKLVGYRFNTIGVSDGISMGTDGMSYSLQSRDVIAGRLHNLMVMIIFNLMIDSFRFD
jgi:dihydroxy-acid dehydratase